jgi:hypothetical protein
MSEAQGKRSAREEAAREQSKSQPMSAAATAERDLGMVSLHLISTMLFCLSRRLAVAITNILLHHVRSSATDYGLRAKHAKYSNAHAYMVCLQLNTRFFQIEYAVHMMRLGSCGSFPVAAAAGKARPIFDRPQPPGPCPMLLGAATHAPLTPASLWLKPILTA